MKSKLILALLAAVFVMGSYVPASAQDVEKSCEEWRCEFQARLDAECDCSAASNHGRYVSCVAHIVNDLLWFGVLAWCYVTGYLGATRVLVLVARRFHVASPALSVLLTLMLASAGVAAPLILEGLAVGFHQLDYSVVQITNWPWTLSYCLMKGMSAHVEVLLIAPCVAFVFLIINVFLAGREVGQVREETVLPPPS